MITDRELIRSLYRYGHFRNPKYPAGFNVSEMDADSLRLADQVVKDAVSSYQEFMYADFDKLVQYHHGRAGEFDGVVGPATRDLVVLPRCGRPDFEADEFGAISLEPDQGSGSWPMPCQKTGVTYSVDKSRMPGSLVPRIDNVMKLVEAAYANIGLRLIRVPSGGNIRIAWRPLVGSTIGIAGYNNQSCSDVVTCDLDTSYADLMFELITHELGHCCNLGHTRKRTDFMYPSVQELPQKLWLPTDSSYSTLVRYFDGRPLDEIPTPTTPPPVPTTPPPTTPPPRPLSFWERFLLWLRGG